VSLLDLCGGLQQCSSRARKAFSSFAADRMRVFRIGIFELLHPGERFDIPT
jgi:hypothetical protein